MTTPIEVPAAAQAALDAGRMYVVAAELALPAAQSADGAGAPWLWTTAHRNVLHGGKTYLAGKVLRNTAFSALDRRAEGRVSLVLFDPERLWEARMLAAGVRGNAVAVQFLLPLADGTWWRMQRFAGTTEAVEPTVDRRDGRLLALKCEDALYRAKIVPGEFSTDGRQRQLSAEAGQSPYDNSHAEAARSRRKRWHTR